MPLRRRSEGDTVPLILHRCPSCKRLFDSPSVCIGDGAQTEQFVRPIKVAVVKKLPKGQPMGVGIIDVGSDVNADVYVAVDFETGEGIVWPQTYGAPGEGAWGSAGPARTPGLNIELVVEHKPTPRPAKRRWWQRIGRQPLEGTQNPHGQVEK